MVTEWLTNPTTALWAAAVTPFAARYFVAWTAWIRVHGWILGSANIEPRRQTADYPAPNSPAYAFVVMCCAAVLAWLPAVVVSTTLTNANTPSWLWSGCYAVSAIASVVYAFRRIHADDVRTQKVLHDRLIAQSESTSGQP